jgi:hypothetical protein
MDHAARVRVMQRLRALVHDGDDLVDRQQAAGAAVRAQRTCAVHVLGDDVAAAVLLARVEDRHDVRVLQLADHLRLAHEHAAGIAALGVVPDRGVVELDRHVAPVERVVRQVDRARAAAAHLVHDVVLADPVWRARQRLHRQRLRLDMWMHGRRRLRSISGLGFRHVYFLMTSSRAAAMTAAITSSSIIPSPPRIP